MDNGLSSLLVRVTSDWSNVVSLFVLPITAIAAAAAAAQVILLKEILEMVSLKLLSRVGAW